MIGRARGIKDRQGHNQPDDTVVISELGVCLRRERNRRHDREADAASRFGVSLTTYHRWEAGISVPDYRHYGVVADYLGETPEEIWRIVAGEPFTNNGRLRAEVGSLTRLLSDQAQTIENLRAELAQIRSKKPDP